jgi:predicted ATPase
MANRVSSRTLVGRHEELDLLAGLLGRAAAGEDGAALVTGEAGVGKSRLVAELARRARESGALALVGECVDLAQAELPYAPVAGALRAVVRERTEPELHRLLGPARGELARLLPELGEPAPATAGGQARLFELLLGVLARLGREQPVLLAFEDATGRTHRPWTSSASSSATSAPSASRSC